MIYADTSLLLSVYVPEVNSAQANAVLQGATDLVISDLIVAEVHVGLARKVKTGGLSIEAAEAVRRLFEQQVESNLLRRAPLLGTHSEAAARLAWQSPILLRTLDVLHLAVAQQLGAKLATLDSRLSDAGRALGFEVLP